MLKEFVSTGLGWLWVSVMVVVLDQLSKAWMVSHLALYEPLTILPFFNLTLAHNTGAAFSFLDSAGGWQHVFFISLAVIITMVILRWLRSLPVREALMGAALSLVLGGAIGNVIDRVHYHYVVDFLDFHVDHWHFAIFNIADSAISIGAVLIAISWLRSAR